MAVTALCLVLAACSSAPTGKKKVKFSEEKYGVAASPKVVADNKPVPKGGGRYMVGKPYKIAGKWYRPKDDPNYESVGLASWYGPTFHGRQTANGEVFDRNALTAAHTTMPIPSYARVTNVTNGRSLIVRVNDRGPFHGKRTIDLSERAATMLDYKSKGVAKVKVEYIGRARLDGLDESYLMASYRGPGAVAPGATQPGTLLAQATPPAGLVGPAPVPRGRPYGAALASNASFSNTVTAAFDPAIAFEAGENAVRVASLNGFSGAAGQTSPALGYNTPAASGSQALPGGIGSRETGGTFVAGSAISSYVADRRIAAAYSAFAEIEGGSSLSELADKTR
nr:septal ring lytic transglycosylase RlpA family protein [Stappia stellulata]